MVYSSINNLDFQTKQKREREKKLIVLSLYLKNRLTMYTESYHKIHKPESILPHNFIFVPSQFVTDLKKKKRTQLSKWTIKCIYFAGRKEFLILEVYFLLLFLLRRKAFRNSFHKK